MATSQDALAAVLAGLRREFEEGLPERAAALRALGPAALAGDAGARADLKLNVHSLAGMGATFGHPAVSDTARALEDLMDAGADGAPLPAGAGPLLEELLAILDGIGGT